MLLIFSYHNSVKNKAITVLMKQSVHIYDLLAILLRQLIVNLLSFPAITHSF